MNSKISYLIEQLKDIQDGYNWIGSSFDKKLNSISDELVFIKPREGILSIAEHISHLTLWREETILKIKTGKGSKTDTCEENFLSLEKLQKKGWNNILTTYKNSLNEIINLLEDKNDDFLDMEYYDTDFKGNYTYNFLLKGMLHHDIYHLGQIGITIKFLKK